MTPLTSSPGTTRVLSRGMPDAQRRLAAAALELAVAFAAVWVITTLTVPDPSGASAVRAVAGVATFAACFGVLARARWGAPLDARAIDWLVPALLWIGTLGMAVVEQWRPLPATAQASGMSFAGLWLFAWPFVTPRSRFALVLPLGASLALLAAVIGVSAAWGPRDAPSLLGWAALLAPAAAVVGLHRLPSLAVLDLAEQRTGAYRLIERIGEGGMGEVWLASHKLLARPAAVKLIRPEVLDRHDRDAHIRRFTREAQVTSHLTSNHTIALYDFGVADDGRFFYVMEYLDGLDLEQLSDTTGPMHPGRAVHLIQQACLSLGEAHAAGLVHRDIKPSNLFVCRQGLEADHLTVLDFGLVGSWSQAADFAALGGDVGMSRVDGVVGTPAFLSPEAIRGGTIDHRADIYALGAVLYWLLTCRVVFPRPTVPQMLHAHVFDEPAPPGRLVEGGLPPELDALVLDCLAKDPAARPPSMEALRDRLLACPVPKWTEGDARAWWDRHRPVAGATTNP